MTTTMQTSTDTWVRPRAGGKVHKIYGMSGSVQGSTNCGVRADRLVKVAQIGERPTNACEKCFPARPL